jgi:uncharacterized membrane protein YdjX (TVP38/TMEM64 family)
MRLCLDSNKIAGAVKLLFIFLLLLAVPLAWRWSPLNEWVNFATIIDWQRSIEGYPAAFYLVIAAYLVAGLLLFPVTVLNVATVLTFGPIVGNFYALCGWLASAALGYGIGRGLGREMVSRLTLRWGHRLLEPADRHGFLTVLTVRVLPVGPFTLVNFFIGAARIRFRDFFLASAIGRIPGIVLLMLAGFQVEMFFRQPDVIGLVVLGLTLVLVPLGFGQLSKRFLPGAPRPAEPVNSSPES